MPATPAALCPAGFPAPPPRGPNPPRSTSLHRGPPLRSTGPQRHARKAPLACVYARISGQFDAALTRSGAVGTPVQAFLLHFAPPHLTCGFTRQISPLPRFRLVPVEEGGVQWGAVE